MGEKAICLDIALLCCIFNRLRLVKIGPHTRAIFHNFLEFALCLLLFLLILLFDSI